jgi:hypothetical protein
MPRSHADHALQEPSNDSAGHDLTVHRQLVQLQNVVETDPAVFAHPKLGQLVERDEDDAHKHQVAPEEQEVLETALLELYEDTALAGCVYDFQRNKEYYAEGDLPGVVARLVLLELLPLLIFGLHRHVMGALINIEEGGPGINGEASFDPLPVAEPLKILPGEVEADDHHQNILGEVVQGLADDDSHSRPSEDARQQQEHQLVIDQRRVH